MALLHPTLPGDVDRAVVNDHAAVLRLLEHLETGSGDRRTLADQVVHRFSVLSAGMEQVVLPAVAKFEGDAGRRPVSAIVDEAVSGQHAAKERLAVLEAAEPGEPEFAQALLRLIEGTRVHFTQVADELLPVLRRSGADLHALGADYLAARRRSSGHVHPDAPVSPAASRIVHAVTSVIDGLRDRSSGRTDRLTTDASGLLDHDAQRVIDAFAQLEPDPLDSLDVADARQRGSIGAVLSAPEPAPVGKRTIDGVPVVLFRPAGAEETLPVVVYAHGGGGVLGAAVDLTAQALSDQLDSVVVSVDYRLAPEHPFPAGHEDYRVVLEWVLANARELGADPALVVAAGESMGANIAASACLSLTGGSRPVALLMIVPVTTAAQDTPSMLDSAEAATLDRPSLDWFLTHLFGQPTDATDPRFALLEAPAEALATLPPTHVVTADRDPLRDQGELFAARLSEAGVATTLNRYSGVPHNFFALGADLQASVQAQLDAATALRPYLA
ncbi:alpha/beta hydrolase fold domain-containing protein [Cryptosporangium aurantiacum]|uniref:Acetyl esterase/lipase n=1 Tax=Cryptosporangium aurantiacum TaxID=134849 RepID=A0A1M7RD96_9ACTN|nr:alpha/beta hydrolase fold domain-containing protein [Cryptosporangium aurantiacum]SHN44196.1 Acetyl esterase/lipase [Cryptosporangium aurantiacum]